MEENYFNRLYEVDYTDKIKKKNNLNYLPWSSAWAYVKEIYPDATFKIYENENGRFWFDDGKSGWVRVSTTVNGVEYIEDFPIMDYKNAALSADKIMSTDANKSAKRALVKSLAFHGLGLALYEGEELASDGSRITKDERDLEKARKKLISVCKNSVNAGKPRDAIYDTIKKLSGNKNPAAVATVEKCNEIIAAIEVI